MFDKAIIDTDKFMDLPMSTKALYFLFGMEADDEGFVSPRRVMRVHGGSDDDIRMLAAKGFVIPFESGVIVITDWHENNYLNKTRLKPTRHIKESEQLSLTEGNRYVLNNGLTDVKPEQSRVEENRVEEKKPRARTKSLLAPEVEKNFETFWSSYPNKTAKKKAWDIWVKLQPTGTLFDVIMQGLERSRKSSQWMKDGGQFIPHPTTWLNQERWTDEGASVAHGRSDKF